MKDVMQPTQALADDGDFNAGFNALIDFRNSTAIGFRMDVSDYVNLFRKTVVPKGTVRVGVLYSTPNQEFLLKVYKGFGKLMNLKIENFRQTGPCMKWMNFSESEATFILQTLTAIKSNSGDLMFRM